MGVYTERIARGAALLDSKKPGWRNHIQIADLAFESLQRCVLGQVFGDFSAAYDTLGLSCDDTATLGFCLEGHEFAGYSKNAPACLIYEGLTREWREYIAATRAVEA